MLCYLFRFLALRGDKHIDLSRQIPVVELAVNYHLAGRRTAYNFLCRPSPASPAPARFASNASSMSNTNSRVICACMINPPFNLHVLF